MGQPHRKDQYKDPIPTDLVALPDIANLDKKGIRTVEWARWYVVIFPDGKESVILASAQELKGLSEDDPIDFGIDLSRTDIEVLYVADILKRHEEKGFYHA